MISEKEKKAVILLSGGLDSTTVLAIARAEDYACYCLSFDYGQRQNIELERARTVADDANAAEHLILRLDLDKIGGSALTSSEEVPKNRSSNEINSSIPSTYVPARNLVFLSHAAAWAEVLGAKDIFIGVNALDYSGYPDCRPEFIDAFEKMVNLGTRAGIEGDRFTIHTPLISLSKAEIIRKGLELGVDYSRTHSCYDPDSQGRACGACDSCLLRLKGFKEAGLTDPVTYRDEQEDPMTGALFMAGLPGKELDDSTRRLIAENGVSSFIIFSRNVENPAQLKELCGDLAAECSANGLPKPLIAIDQEGGTVTRLPAPWTRFPDARLLAESNDPETALTDYARTCCRELLAAGINMNLAPVLDVCPAGEGYFMERRSLGAEPAKVARLGCLVISEFQKAGVAACVKHFPGLGAARLDPHLVLPVVDREEARLQTEDLPPFQAAVDNGVAAIMTSHTIYKNIDPEQPATLSEKILTGILRDKMAYEGLVVTDDLEMGAIENESTVAKAALRSFQAGADLLLICQDHRKVREAIALFEQALQNGSLSRTRLELSLKRIALVRNDFALDAPPNLNKDITGFTTR